MIYIRADANAHIGMGHIMRCLSIADAARSIITSDIVFVLASNDVKALIQSRGYRTIVLHTNYRDLDAELPAWPAASPEYILVDSYYVTVSYLSALRAKAACKLVYMDDLAAFPYPVDMLVNYNAYAQVSTYTDLYRTAPLPQLCLGPQYAPLRAMFRALPARTQPRQVQHVLLSTGGADAAHIALSLVQTLTAARTRDARVYHLLIGALNTDQTEIESLVSKDGGIVLHQNVADMRALICSCDLAVSAAGSTMYEICACGVPVITYILADNQIPGAEAFAALGLAENLGDMRDIHNRAERILAAVDQLCHDFDRRVTVGKTMQALVDGLGAERLCRQLIS